MIKLPPSATEDDHLALLGLLNSSTACFWMKQVCHNKGSTVDQRWCSRQTNRSREDVYEFDGNSLETLPLSLKIVQLDLARQLDDLAQRLQDHALDGLLHRWQSRGIMPGTASRSRSRSREREWTLQIRERMIALQEELDWECYRLYGLIDEDLTYGVRTASTPLRLARLRDRDAGQDGVGRAPDDLVRAAQRDPDSRSAPEWPQDYQRSRPIAGWRSSQPIRTSR